MFRVGSMIIFNYIFMDFPLVLGYGGGGQMRGKVLHLFMVEKRAQAGWVGSYSGEGYCSEKTAILRLQSCKLNCYCGLINRAVLFAGNWSVYVELNAGN